MYAPFLLILALAATASDPPAVLIERLGADSFDDRVAAYKALERLGGEALPVLRGAVDARDERVRTRVRALIDAIGRQVETDRFARATMVPLDFRDRPLGEVVDALNGRDLGLSLRLGPAPRRGMMIFDPGQPRRLQELRDRRITLEAEQPLPFWEAIDRLCEASSLRYDALSSSGFGAREGFLTLLADRTGRGPVSDSGPFRVQITGVESVFQRDFTRAPDRDSDPNRPAAQPPNAGDLTVSLVVLPEPGLMLHQNGEVVVTDASDDRGRSLAPAPAGSGPGQVDRFHRVTTGRASIDVRVLLTAPDPSGTMIRRLRGKVPVIAVARGVAPIVVPLRGAGGPERSVATRDMTLVIDQVSLDPAPGGQASVRVTYRENRGSLAPGRRGFDPRRPDYAAFNRDRLLEHLELVDAAGRRLNHILSESTRGADGQGFYDRYRLTVAPTVEPGVAAGPGASKTPIPAELRYYDFVQTVMEIPFDFQDVPKP